MSRNGGTKYGVVMAQDAPAWRTGLAFPWYVGSLQSRDGDERLEAKVDYLLAQSEGGESLRLAPDQKHPRH